MSAWSVLISFPMIDPKRLQKSPPGDKDIGQQVIHQPPAADVKVREPEKTKPFSDDAMDSKRPAIAGVERSRAFHAGSSDTSGRFGRAHRKLLKAASGRDLAKLMTKGICRTSDLAYHADLRTAMKAEQRIWLKKNEIIRVAGDAEEVLPQAKSRGDFERNDGKAYIQHSQPDLERYTRLLEVAIGLACGPRQAQEWAKDPHAAGPRLLKDYDGWLTRSLDEQISRFLRIDGKGREWGQLYFALHPKEDALPIPADQLEQRRTVKEMPFRPQMIQHGMVRTADNVLFANPKEAKQHAQELFAARQLDRILPLPPARVEGEATHVVHTQEEIDRYRAAVNEALAQMSHLDVAGGAVRHVLNQRQSPLLEHYERAFYRIAEDGSELRPEPRLSHA